MILLHLGAAVALLASVSQPLPHDPVPAAALVRPTDAAIATLPAGWWQGDPADSLFGAAMETLNAGNFRNAADLFAQLTRQYQDSPHVAEALYWCAFSLYRLGEDNDLRQGLLALSMMRTHFSSAFLNGDAAALEQRILGELARRGDPAATQRVADQAAQLSAPSDSRAAPVSCDAPNPDTPGVDVKITALNALAQMNPDRASATLQAILKRQDEGSVCLRRAAVLLLAQRQTEGVEMSLLDAARSDPDLEVRKQAVLVLSQFTTAQAVSALDSIVRTGTEPELVQRAVMALSQSDDPRAQDALRGYAARGDVPMETRRAVIGWLLGRPSQENVVFLRDLYGRLDVGDLELRRSIIQAVAQQGDVETGHWLLEITRSDIDSLDLRMQALALGRQWATTADLAAVYSPALAAPLRAQLVEIYGSRIGETAALDVLGEVAKKDPDAELRKKAIAFISQSQEPHAAEVLQAVVEGR